MEMVKVLAPGRGLRALRVAFRSLDKDCNGLFNPSDFKFCLKQFGIEISEEETFNLLKYFDSQRCGKISLNDVFHAMRSCSMNERREKAVEKAYKKMDLSGNESVTIADLQANYDVSPNPEYQSGKKTKEQLVCEFLECWDSQACNYVVSYSEFLDFYMDVSPTVCSDEVFENMIKHTWNC